MDFLSPCPLSEDWTIGQNSKVVATSAHKKDEYIRN